MVPTPFYQSYYCKVSDLDTCYHLFFAFFAVASYHYRCNKPQSTKCFLVKLIQKQLYFLFVIVLHVCSSLNIQ